jgi:hypothetical protein
MKAFVKYAGVLALGLAIGSYLHGLKSLEDVGKLAWLDEISNTINKALASAKPDAALAFVDQARAAIVDEELDFCIAQRINSVDGWRSFLAAHRSGAYAAAASAEVENVLLAATGPAQSVAEDSDGVSQDEKAGSEAVASSDAPVMESAALTQDEICEPEREGAAQQPVNGEVPRFATESGCEKLRPQLVGLVEDPDQPAPRPAVEHPSPAFKFAPALASKWRAPMPPERPRLTAPSQQPRRATYACPVKEGACSWRGREELVAVNRVGKKFAFQRKKAVDWKIAFW